MASRVKRLILVLLCVLTCLTLSNGALEWHFRLGVCPMANPTSVIPAFDVWDCQQLCELETNFDCKAIVLYDNSSDCHLWATSSTHVNTTICPEGTEGTYEVKQVELWTTLSRRTLYSNNLGAIPAQSVEQCKVMCEEQKDIRCLSFVHDLAGNSLNRCWLSWENSMTTELGVNELHEHFELIQSPAWQHRPDECVEGSSVKVIVDVDPRDCLAACALEPQFDCLAVNYDTNTRSCELFDRAKVNSDTKRCSAPDIHYYGKKPRTLWRREQDACTTRDFSQAIEHVTPHGCLELCEVYYPATCRSVMYKRAPPGPTVCYLFDEVAHGDGRYISTGCPLPGLFEYYTPRTPENC